jgi:hypothetical protein
MILQTEVDQEWAGRRRGSEETMSFCEHFWHEKTRFAVSLFLGIGMLD